MGRKIAAALIVGFSLSACGSLPSGAPTASEFEHPGATADRPDYLLFPLDRTAIRHLADVPTPGLAAAFGRSSYRPGLVLRAGDVIGVTIFDLNTMSLLGSGAPAHAGAAGAASPPIGGLAATLPAQTVELDGTITIPFGGRVKVAGLTPLQAGRQIERTLEGKSGNAQAVVTLVATVASSVTVGGDVGRPGQVALTVRGERVLDAVANAGGTRFPAYDCDVQLIRGGRTARINLQRVVDDTRENLTLEPGDNLFVAHAPRSFAVLGSASKVAQYDFNAERVTLAEAIARSGGPNDNAANLADLYLLRYAPRALVDHLLPPADPRRAILTADDRPVPVAFHVELNGGAGYFHAQEMEMRDKDIILVTNADSVALQKLLGLVRGVSTVLSDVKFFQAPTNARRE